MNNIRQPAVAGQFYPADRGELEETISKYIKLADSDKKIANKAVSFAAPHAGYIYSGSIAAYTYKALADRIEVEKTDTFIIIGPNHTGKGENLSLSACDWITPLGKARNDKELTKKIAAYSEILSIDEEAHSEEHSVEVQVPFLQKAVKDPKCVFICMKDQSYWASELLFKAITNAEKNTKRKIIVIASSDFNHYESEKIAKLKDLPAITAITQLDALRFQKVLEQNNDTACGYGPITVAALYAKFKNAGKGYLLKYATSGSFTKDYDSVVAYASIIFA